MARRRHRCRRDLPRSPGSEPSTAAGHTESRRRRQDGTTGGARARCRCSRSWRATSRAGRRTRSSFSSLSDGRSGCGNHLRPQAVRTPDPIGGAHGSAQRRVRRDLPHRGRPSDLPVRGVAQHPNIGFFLWRLGAYRLEAAEARRLGAAGDHRALLQRARHLGACSAVCAGGRRSRSGHGAARAAGDPAGPLFEDLRAYMALVAPPGFTEFYGLFNAVPGFNVAPASAWRCS